MRKSDFRSPLEHANYRLRCWAFDELLRDSCILDEGLSHKRERDYQLGSALLAQTIYYRPVTLRVGDVPHDIHDPMRCPYKTSFDWQRIYEEGCSHATDFYKKTFTLKAGSRLELDTVASFAAPGDKDYSSYVGNAAAARYIQIEDLAVMLHHGGELL